MPHRPPPRRPGAAPRALLLARLLALPLAVPLALLTAGCDEAARPAAPAAQDPRVTAILALRGDPAEGEQTWLTECISCHLEDGTGRAGGGSGKDLTAWLPRSSDAAALAAIIDGRPGMLAYGAALTDAQLADLLAWLRARFDP